jgi:dTDP-4-dehydrorhamnose 3,5-epimerase-like enzyme
MKGLKIEKATSVSLGDVRGGTFELFKGMPGRQVTLYKRKKGASFANHFHKGIDPSKDPELFFVVSGKVTLFAKNKHGEEFECTVEDLTFLTIDKNVYHEFVALTDVVFLEYRCTQFDSDNSDCFSKEEY